MSYKRNDHRQKLRPRQYKIINKKIAKYQQIILLYRKIKKQKAFNNKNKSDKT